MFLSLISFSRIFLCMQLNPPNCDSSGLHGEWEKDTMWRQSIIWWLMLGGHLANSPLQEVPLHSLLLVTFCVYRKMHRCHFTPIICMTLFINMPKHWIKLWQGVRMEQDEMSFATYWTLLTRVSMLGLFFNLLWEISFAKTHLMTYTSRSQRRGEMRGESPHGPVSR